MIRPRTITPLLALALAAAAAFAASAQATDTVLAAAPDTAGLTAYGGQVVLSQLDPATNMWALVRYQDGAFSPLPVPERAVPFDADAGPDAAGNPVVVFSRCATEPAADSAYGPTLDWETATGCELYELNLSGTPDLREITAAASPGESETTPSVWRGNLAFVRHSAGSAVPTIEYLPVGAKKPRHLAGGSVQVCQAEVGAAADCAFKMVHDTVDQLDLGPSRISYLWSMVGGSLYGVGPAYELRSATLDGGRSELLDSGESSGTCGFDLPSAATATTGAISYLAAGAECDVTVTSFATVDPVTGIHSLAPTPGGLATGAVLDGNTIYWLRVTGPPADVGVPSGGACLIADAGCQLVASSVPQYVPQPVLRESPPADIDLVRSGLGYSWVSEGGGVQVLRPPATIPCAPSAAPAYVELSAQWTRGKHTVRISRQDPHKAPRSVGVTTRSLPLGETYETRLIACGDSTRFTYAVTTAGSTKRVSFTVDRLKAPASH